MTPAPFRLGLVGCGRLAEIGYVPAVVATPGVRIAALADPDAGRRQALAALVSSAGCGTARRGEVRAVADAAALLDAAEVDGLIVASPVGAHLADAALASTAGVPTLVEKPPARTGEEAARLASLDPPPWVGFNRRFDPGARRVRDAVRNAVPPDGAGGTVDLVVEIAYRRAGWGAVAVRDDALLDLGPHLVDWARWLTGAEVAGVARAAVTAERATVELTFDRGRARLRAATDRPHVELVEVRDGDGRVLARHRIGGFASAVRGRLRRSGPSALVTSLAGQLAAFVAAARAETGTAADGGVGPETLGTAADGLAAMLVVDAARASAAGACPVSLITPEVP